MRNRVEILDLPWSGVDSIVPKVKQWGDILYNEERHIGETFDGDFYVDSEMNLLDTPDDIIVTRWGREFETSFHCITGYGLYELMPWWRTMQQFFINQLKLTPWLPYPCLLLSKSNLRRHIDVGRPTAFNYPIFGEDITTNHVWYDKDADDSSYNETYKYELRQTVVIDTTVDHGGFVNPSHHEDELRAICNMGFAEPFDSCIDVILQAYQSGELVDVLRG